MEKWIKATRHYASLMANNPDNPAEAAILSAVVILGSILFLSWFGKIFGVAMPTNTRSSLTVLFTIVCLVTALSITELLLPKLFPGAGRLTVQITLAMVCFAVVASLIIPAGCLLLKSHYLKTLAVMLITAAAVIASVFLAKAVISSAISGSNFLEKTKTNTRERSF